MMRAAAFSIVCLAVAPAWGATVLISDPLTDGKCSGNVSGGQFESEGWRAVNGGDYLYYALPDGLIQSSVQFEIKVGSDVSGEARKHFWQVFERNESTSNDSNNLIMLRLYVNNSKEGYDAGEVRFRMGGPDFGKKQADTPASSRDPGKWYTVRINWTGSDATHGAWTASPTKRSTPPAQTPMSPTPTATASWTAKTLTPPASPNLSAAPAGPGRAFSRYCFCCGGGRS